jgi:hypothetical protein
VVYLFFAQKITEAGHFSAQVPHRRHLVLSMLGRLPKIRMAP